MRTPIRANRNKGQRIHGISRHLNCGNNVMVLTYCGLYVRPFELNLSNNPKEATCANCKRSIAKLKPPKKMSSKRKKELLEFIVEGLSKMETKTGEISKAINELRSTAWRR